ncbi:trypsin-like peptidase domain-containing protein [Candidatus Thiothrix sp. Deng01]|uniref:Trypsin-like peptidase domain-containing protein n=1 Tax=Candidatus Thiothrix phosphatis TaxID=3112415 RepID=A0ABU6CVL7_9GAMM|nr:trypsin-like peptidase domain-containing protein [Candidatus Thiothrix sp. Deng01]MEB4590877.1 trypsin-like peptidase domain-containing protein [Candidatus Thiothrix sp. Deng01]
MTDNRALNLFLWMLLGVLLLWVAQPVWVPLLHGSSASVAPRPVVARGDLAADEQAAIAIFEQNSPSVVYITTVERVLSLWSRNVQEIPSGTGTGFVWDKAGHIVTNYHVVEGHKSAKVRLSDQRVFDALVVGVSPEHDLAVLQLQEAADVPPPVQIGSSGDLRVGQKVLAIGNPFGLDHSLTAGIISALKRSIDSEDGGGMDGLIQTDAAINPGNSGGPLLDSAGRLIGVNVAIYSPSGASAGIGFAIPVDVVNRVVPRLVKDGHYTRAVLGVMLDDSISEAVNAKLGTQGVLVLQVQPDSPAAEAGIRSTELTARDDLVLGDIIQAIDGQPVNSADQLNAILDNYVRNGKVKVTLLREGKQTLEVEVVLSLFR